MSERDADIRNDDERTQAFARPEVDQPSGTSGWSSPDGTSASSSSSGTTEGYVSPAGAGAGRGDTPERSSAYVTPEPPAGPDPAAAQEARRQRFGGLNPGAAFFGWVVAVAMSVLIAAVVGAVLLVVRGDSTLTLSRAWRQVLDQGLTAGITLLAIVMIGYYCGGYVAGRMSRFSGTRQGFGVWVIGVGVSIVLVGLGVLFGQQNDLLGRIDLPGVTVTTSSIGASLTSSDIIGVLVVMAATLLAALLGGAVGTRYHRRVDRAGWNL